MKPIHDYEKRISKALDTGNIEQARALSEELVIIYSERLYQLQKEQKSIITKHSLICDKPKIAKRKYRLDEDEALDFLEKKFSENHDVMQDLLKEIDDLSELDRLLSQEQIMGYKDTFNTMMR